MASSPKPLREVDLGQLLGDDLVLVVQFGERCAPRPSGSPSSATMRRSSSRRNRSMTSSEESRVRRLRVHRAH